MEIEELIYVPNDLSKYLLVEGRQLVDPSLKSLLN